MRRLAILGLFALIGCGGGDGDTLVVINIDRGGVVGTARRIDLALTLDGTRMAGHQLSEGGNEIRLPTSALIGVNQGEGRLLVVATAYTDGDLVLESGSSVGMVVRGQTETVDITLGVDLPVDPEPDGGGMALLDIDPPDHDFGSQVEGQTSQPVSFTVRNRGDAASAALTAALGGAGAANFSITSNGCAGALAAGGSCTVEVAFAPSSPGAKAATLDVSGGGAALQASLRGVGEVRGSLAVADTVKDFGPVLLGASSAPATFTLSSSGDTGALTVSLVGNDAGQFALDADGCSGSLLSASTSCTVTVHFQPAGSGRKTASLRVSASPGGVAVASLSGTGERPARLIVSPTMASFGATLVGTPSATTTLTFSNDGDVATSALTTQAPPSDFEVTANSCGAALAGGATCSIDVRLSAATRGVKMGTLSVSGSPGGMASVDLSGVAQTPAALAINPSSSAFGTVITGNAAVANFTITNSGEVAAGPIAASVGGPDVAELTLSNNGCTGMLMPNASCSLQVTFAPTGTGAKSAALTVTASPGGTLTANLTGTGSPPGTITIAPSAKDFGGVQVGTPSTTSSFTVTNMGGGASGALSTLLSAGAASEFTVVSDTCANTSLAVGGTCTIGVRLAPGSAGGKTDSLVVSGSPGGMAAASLSGSGLAPPQLALSPSAHGFPGTVVGGTSAAQSFTVTNTGGVASGTPTLALSGSGASHFVLGASSCSGTLGPGATCTVSLSFRPGSAGAKSAALDVTGSPGGSATAMLTGSGLSPPALVLTPSPHGFGSVQVGQQSSSQTFTVRNSGDVPTGALTTSVTGPFAIIASTCSGALMPSATCTVSARFSPSARGAATGGLTASDGTVTGSAMLTGTGTDALLTITPSPYGYGSVVLGAGATQTFTITNGGDATSGALTLALGGAQAGDFALGGGTCVSGSTTLAPSSFCTKVVTFTPTAAGARAASLSASANPGGSVTSALSGNGITMGMLTSSPATYDYGSVLVGSNSSTQTFTIQNSGGVATGTLSATVPAPFAITSNGCSGALAPSQTCTVVVRFSPVMRGAASGDLQVGDGSLTTQASLSGLGTDAILTLSPAPASFGGVAVGGSSTLTFTVRNTGDATSGALAMSVAGGQAADFTLSGGSCTLGSTTLAPNMTCTKVVTFRPGAAGARATTLTASGAPGGAATSALSGSGLAPPALSVSPTSRNYGSIAVGSTSSAFSFTFSNDGDVATGALSASITGQFTISTNNCAGLSLGSGQTCTVSARFAPTSVGSKSGTLTVGDGNVSAAPSLSGQGSQAVLTLTPAPHNFGFVLVGSSATQTFTVTNAGDATSGAVSMTVSGTHASDFSLSGGTCTLGSTTLAPGSTCTKVVTFRPGARLGRSATLTASASPGGSPSTALSGTGQAPAALSVSVTSRPFGSINVGSSSTAYGWVITNSGDVASGTPSVATSGSHPGDFTHSGCGSMIAGNSTCTLNVTFTPAAAGTRSATKTVSASPGGSVSLAASGTGVQPLVLTVSPSGTGRITSIPAGIDCPGTCSAGFSAGTGITLQARTSNGSGYYFRGWTSGNCSGSVRDCAFTLNASGTVGALFSPQTYNLAFASSQTYPGTLGGTAPYDAACNMLASNAGINNAAGNNFVAFISDANSNVQQRLGGAQSFVRLDGQVVTNSLSGTLTSSDNRLYNPINVSENGAHVSHSYVWTGTAYNGTTSSSCGNWTGSGSGGMGGTGWGPSQWIGGGESFGCASAQYRLFCMAKASSATPTPSTTAGKIIFLTNNPVPLGSGYAGMVAACAGDRPNGSLYLPLVSTTTSKASTALGSQVTYVTVGGQRIGTGAQLISGGELDGGIWQSANGSFANQGSVHTGASTPSAFGTVTSTCNDFQNSTGSGQIAGVSSHGDTSWWTITGQTSICYGFRVYCVEQ